MTHAHLESASEDGPEIIQDNDTASSGDIVHDKEFYFSDGNLRVLVDKRAFMVHRYKLEEFRTIKTKMVTEGSSDAIELPGDPDDFRGAFKLLYAPLYMADHLDLKPADLISTLRIATLFDHPLLRSFVTLKLEALSLPPIDYIPIARELKITRWEDMAIDKLTNRDEPLTSAEAFVLGTKTLASIAAKRESKLREQTFTVPSATDFGKLSSIAQKRLKEQFQAMLGLSEPSSSDSPDSDSAVSPSSSSPDPADSPTNTRKRARIPGNIEGIVHVHRSGARYCKVRTSVRGILSGQKSSSP